MKQDLTPEARDPRGPFQIELTEKGLRTTVAGLNA